MVFPANFINGILNTPLPNCFTVQEVLETDGVGNGTQIFMIIMMLHDRSL